MGRLGGWVCQVARQFRWVRKVGCVGSWYNLVWFGQNSEAEFKIINQVINLKGGYRAARAAKKYKR